jgi:hypothetical protein
MQGYKGTGIDKNKNKFAIYPTILYKFAVIGG